MPAPQLPRRVRAVVAVALVAWVVLLVVTLLGPSAEGPAWLVESIAGVADSLGVPPLVTGQTELILNAVAFAPVSLLGRLLWPRYTWRDWTAGGFVASFLVEAFQALFLAARSATFVDVVSNTLGALGGALLAAVVARVLLRTTSEGRADLPHRASPAEQDELPR